MGAKGSTFLEKEGQIPEDRLKNIAKSPAQFWEFLAELPKKRNKIAAWNFCYASHRILCNASATDICQLRFNTDLFQQLGSYWTLHSSQQYAVLIFAYTDLLVSRLKFHDMFPNVSGQFNVTTEELKKKVEIKAEFKIMVDEILSYREKNLVLQDAIMASLNKVKATSKTAICQKTPLTVIFKEYRWISNLLKKVDKLWESTPIHDFYQKSSAQNKRYEKNWTNGIDYKLPVISIDYN